MKSNSDNIRPDHFFLLPNIIFSLGLSLGEIAVYSYLLYCEDRKTYQCYPSYGTIGRALQISNNTVRKYVHALEDKQFIYTEQTKVRTKSGKVQNGNLLFTIRPIEEAKNYYYERQFKENAEKELEFKHLNLAKKCTNLKVSEQAC